MRPKSISGTRNISIAVVGSSQFLTRSVYRPVPITLLAQLVQSRHYPEGLSQPEMPLIFQLVEIVLLVLRVKRTAGYPDRLKAPEATWT
jgi:hypothetical protein